MYRANVPCALTLTPEFQDMDENYTGRINLNLAILVTISLHIYIANACYTQLIALKYKGKQKSKFQILVEIQTLRPIIQIFKPGHNAAEWQASSSLDLMCLTTSKQPDFRMLNPITTKVNLKLSPCLINHQAMKAYKGWKRAPFILNFGTKWRFVVSLTSRSLYPRMQIPRYPQHRRVGGPWGSVWMLARREKSFSSAGNQIIIPRS